jgi:ATP-dependent helicase/nuclease subunit A
VNSCSVVLSPEQSAAILTPGHVLVRAGAGSGKTEVLARRFAALIAGDIQGRPRLAPVQVAAITFTEKAAYDMRARIATVLEQRIQDHPHDEHRAHLLTACAQLPLARISTIHAFCARILRENAVEAGLDPDFQVLDDYESQTFLERVCKQFLIDQVRGSDPGACYLALTRGVESGTPREGALAIVMRILDEVARLGRTPEWLYTATRDAAARFQAEARRVELLARELGRLLDELLSLRELSDAAEQTLAPLRLRHREFRDFILSINAQLEPDALGLLREFCEYLPEARGRVHDCVVSIKKIVKRGAGRFGLDGELVSIYGAFRAFPRALEIAAMVRKLALRFERAKADERLVTFNDLLFLTRELLERDAAVRVRYKVLLRALLVDEFQDTDQVQHEIVTGLVEAEAGGEGEAPDLFVVGDEKQSIYRFRGADVAGLGRVKGHLGAGTTHELALLGNRRSAPNIVGFINGLGGALMHAAEQPSPPYWVEWGPEHELCALRTPALDPAVEVIVAIADARVESAAAPVNSALSSNSALTLSAAHKRMLEGPAIASRINEMVRGEMVTDLTSGDLRQVRYRDIVVLLRAFTDVAIYESALLDAAIPCYTIKGRGFFGSQEVLDIIELLTAVDDPRDSLALAAALRSPLFGLSDDCLAEIALHRELSDGNGERPSSTRFSIAFGAGGPGFLWLSAGRDDAVRAWQILDELRKLRQRGTIVGVVEQALAATSYEAVMLGLRQGPQRVANVRKLLDLARDFESRRFFTFHDFVVYLRHLVEQQPYEPPAQILGESENVVRLMTVHQAKGLEFPVVFLADAGRRPDTDARNPVADPENGLLMRDAVGSGMDEIPNKILADFRRRSSREQAAESLRLLYVALTRARDRLIISEGPIAQGWAKQIRSFVGEECYAAFVNSGKAQQLIELADAKIVLVRPDSAQAGRNIQLANDAPSDAAAISALARHRLSYEPSYARELVISPTALADFERCPRQFHFRHQIRIPEPTASAGGSKSRASTMGTVAHDVLQRLDLAASDEGEIQQLVNSVGNAAGLNSSEREIIAADLVRCMAKLASSPCAAREVPFFYHVGEGLFIRGQIDALIEEPNRVIIRDYKYAHASDEASPYQLPMEAYASAVAEAHPGSNIEAQLFFLKDDGEPIPVALPPLSEIRERILSLGRQIIAAQSAGEFPKKPPSATVCRRLRCGFVDHCWKDR